MCIFNHLLNFQIICKPKQIKQHWAIQKILGKGDTIELVLFTQMFISRKLIHSYIIIVHLFTTGQVWSISSERLSMTTLTQIDFYLISEFFFFF